jgi:hypothetical protein
VSGLSIRDICAVLRGDVYDGESFLSLKARAKSEIASAPILAIVEKHFY